MQRDKSSTTIVFEALLGGWLRCGLRVSALKMECLDAVADSVSFDDLNGVQRLNSLERLEQMCAGLIKYAWALILSLISMMSRRGKSVVCGPCQLPRQMG